MALRTSSQLPAVSLLAQRAGIRPHVGGLLCAARGTWLQLLQSMSFQALARAASHAHRLAFKGYAPFSLRTNPLYKSSSMAWRLELDHPLLLEILPLRPVLRLLPPFVRGDGRNITLNSHKKWETPSMPCAVRPSLLVGPTRQSPTIGEHRCHGGAQAFSRAHSMFRVLPEGSQSQSPPASRLIGEDAHPCQPKGPLSALHPWFPRPSFGSHSH